LGRFLDYFVRQVHKKSGRPILPLSSPPGSNLLYEENRKVRGFLRPGANGTLTARWSFKSACRSCTIGPHAHAGSTAKNSSGF